MTNNVEREKIHDPKAYKLKTYVLFRLKLRIISTQNMYTLQVIVEIRWFN